MVSRWAMKATRAVPRTVLPLDGAANVVSPGVGETRQTGGGGSKRWRHQMTVKQRRREPASRPAGTLVTLAE